MERTIYLYIKESPRGLKYLGHTIKKDPFKYRGSGIRWSNHLKYHKIPLKDIKTTILLETKDRSIISFWGMYYSKVYNVVEDDNWANLMPESGESSLGYKHTKESLKKMSDLKKGIVKSEEFKAHLRSLNLGKFLSEEHKKKIGEANSKFKRTEEQKLYLRNINLGKKKSLETREKVAKSHWKKVSQYSLDSVLIKEWISIKEASETLNVRNSQISGCCRGRYLTAGGFKWKYSNN